MGSKAPSADVTPKIRLTVQEESGAQKNNSDGSCPERNVTVTGHPNAILKLFQLFNKPFEEPLPPPINHSPTTTHQSFLRPAPPPPQSFSPMEIDDETVVRQPPPHLALSPPASRMEIDDE